MTNSRNIYSALVITSIAFLAYFNTFANSFHLDDFRYILHNEEFKEHIQRPFSISETFSNLSNRSIVLATLHLNHFLDGFNVFGFHILNLTVHITTCLLIFLFVKEIILNSGFLRTNDHPAIKLNIPLTSALLFAVHPINTQAVTYITGRTTSLAACFYIASFLFFIKGLRQNLPRKVLFFIISIFLLIAGYGSKIIILTAPAMFIIFYLFFIPSKTIPLKCFLENKYTGIFIKTIVMLSPFILIFISRHLDFQQINTINFGLLQILFDPIQAKLISVAAMAKDTISSSIYLLTEFKIIIFYYIKMVFLPFNQNIDPDFPIAHGITDAGVILSLTIIALLLFVGIYYYKKNRLIAFGIFWFFITLLPTSTIFPLLDTVTEHRLYIPLVGIILIIPVFINPLINNNKNCSLKLFTCLSLLVFFPITVLFTLTVNRNVTWKDEKSLWLDAAEKSPRRSRPLNNLGEAYDNEKDYEKAIQTLGKAVAISSTNYKPYNNLGKIYGKIGQLDMAIKNLKLALKYKPDYPIGHYNLGKVYELKGMLDNAINEYSIAFKQRDDFFEACFNLANAYDKNKQLNKSLETYLNCQKFKPSFPKIYFAIGTVFVKKNNLDEAFKYYSRAVELDANYQMAKTSMANIFIMKKNYDEAVEIYKQILKSDPNNFNLHNNFAFILFQFTNNPSQALYHLKKSLEINPEQKNAAFIKGLINNISGSGVKSQKPGGKNG